MASVRVEQSAISDPRFELAAKRMGVSRHDILGRMMFIWEHCTEQQTYYLQPEVVDTIACFEGFSLIICDPIVSLAEATDKGVRIKGTKGRIEWLGRLRKGQKSGGKSRSKKAERNPNGTFQHPIQDTTSTTSSTPSSSHPGQSSVLTLTLSPSLAPSPVLFKKEERREDNAVAHAPALAEGMKVPIPKKSKYSDLTRAKMRAFVAAYADGYKTKYGGSPEGLKSKAVIGKVGDWIEHVSEERACQLVQVYLQIDFRPINESYHDLWNFFRHLNRIGVALDTGKESEAPDWSKIFRGEAS